MNIPIQYVTPRIGIISIEQSVNLENIHSFLQNLHGKYFHIFNLSPVNLTAIGGSYFIPHTNFKWRDIPYSISEAIKILSTLEAFLRPNLANSAFFAVSSKECENFCKFLLQAYLDLLGKSQLKTLSTKKCLLNEFQRLYKSIDIACPPLKIIEAIEFPNQTFIPLYQIYTESRHNNLEGVYFHDIKEELSRYYLEKKKPLEKGIGHKFCSKKPQTKHLFHPVIVGGDVKICFYSYEKLNMQKQFVCGFNTKALEFEQTVIPIESADYYEVGNEKKLGKNHQVLIYISDYCEKCKTAAKCPECVELCKKLNGRYSEAQAELEKLHRQRKEEEIQTILGLSN